MYCSCFILTGTDGTGIQSLKQHLHEKFGIKDRGLLHYFLGIEVNYLDNGIMLSQRKFTQDLLDSSSFDLSKPATTPLPLHLKLSQTDGELISNPELFRSLVGKLNYLTIPDQI